MADIISSLSAVGLAEDAFFQGTWEAEAKVGPDAEIQYQTSLVDSVNRMAYTFASVAIGSPSPTRKIIIGIIINRSVTTTWTINSVTVGGIAATVVVNATTTSGGSNRGMCAIAIADVPTGTVADVSISLGTSGNMENCFIACWRADFVGDLFATVTNFADPAVLDLNTDEGGIAVALADCGGSSTGETWTGLTENFSTLSEAFRATGASGATGAATPLAVRCDRAVPGTLRLGCAASWAKA